MATNRLFVGQVRLKDNENEITAVPQLLDKQHNDRRSVRKRLFRAALSQDYLKEILLNAKF